MRFRQLRGGGGAFWPGPRKQGYGYRIDLKFATNNGTDYTSKRTKFKVIGCSTFRDMTLQNFLSRREQVIAIRYLPWNRANLEKSHLLCLKTFFLVQNYNPFCISIVFKQNKNIHMFNFSRRLISKTTAATPLVNRFC